MKKLVVRRGDDETIEFLIERDNVPYALDDVFVRFTVKRNYDDADSTALIRLSSSTSGVLKLAETGRVDVTFPGVTTREFAANTTGVWDLQLTFLDGTVSTPVSGTVRFSNDVTKNPGLISTDT